MQSSNRRSLAATERGIDPDTGYQISVALETDIRGEVYRLEAPFLDT